MALADLKRYFKQVEDQRNELKELMIELDTALATGYYTEEQVNIFKAQFDAVDANYKRMAFEMHLLSIPNRHSKKLTRADKELIRKCSLLKCTDDYVLAENEDALVKFRKELSALKDTTTKK